ncbi:hypothetical protein MLD38_036949 [Melastoma candidum]|uniref:Uncharacterized protein n=1 Tax=Melastoma candidum TaxID=119954 RepID=A0ACB9LLN4_9MYRT|nr:hypothetical protein MLD38_036949 [Melastoma candidum]
MNKSDPIGRPGETGALFARINPQVFAKKDTIDLLRALLEFSSVKKRLVVYDKNDEYEFVRVRLECSPSKMQFMKKCSVLKTLYLSRLSKGGGEGLTGDDAVVFELSEKLWGEEAMRQVKKKGRERSGRVMTLDELRAELGLGDARPLMEGDAQAESAGLRMESEVEAEKSSGVASGKKKRKREDEWGKVGGTAEDDSGHEVLNDEAGEFVELAESSVKSRSEDGELGGKVRRKKEKKHKVDNSVKERRSLEEGSGSEMTGEGNGNLAIAGDSRADFGQVDGSLASREVSTKKKHKQVERPGELEKLSERGSGNDDDCLARLAERGSADSQLDKGKSSRKKKKHKGDRTAEFKSLSESSSGNEEVNNIDKASKSQRAKVESVSEDGKLVRSTSVKENKHKGDKKGPDDEKSEAGILSRKRKKKNTGLIVNPHTTNCPGTNI